MPATHASSPITSKRRTIVNPVNTFKKEIASSAQSVRYYTSSMEDSSMIPSVNIPPIKLDSRDKW
jgi:hypothetical protein